MLVSDLHLFDWTTTESYENEIKIAANTFMGIGLFDEEGDYFGPASGYNIRISKGINLLVCSYIRFYSTIIIRRVGFNAYILDCRGWRTKSTKERINILLGPSVKIYSSRNVWYVVDSNGEREYYDGIEVIV